MQSHGNSIPAAFTHVLVLDRYSWIVEVPNSQEQSVSDAFSLCSVPPCLHPEDGMAWADNTAKLRNISELLTFGAKFFWRSVNFGALGEK